MEELDLKQLFDMLRKKIIYIIILTIVAIIIGVIYSFYLKTPLYKSKTTIVLTKSGEDSKIYIEDEAGITTADLDRNSKLIKTYSELVKSESVLDKVIEKLNLNLTATDIRKNITVSAVEDTELIEISIKNEDATLAKTIADEIAKCFIERTVEIYQIENLCIVDEAKIATEPCNINHIKDLTIFTMVGIIAGFGIVLVLNLFENTVKDKNMIENNTDLKVIYEIPKFEKSSSKRKNELIVLGGSKSIQAESIKSLRTILSYMDVGKKLSSILITSTVPGEGKSLVSANIAVAFAQLGYKVILIDADMRKGRQNKIFGISKTPGISNYLSGIADSGQDLTSRDIEFFLQTTGIDNLLLMTSGSVQSNSSELLSNAKFDELLNILKHNCDLIIIDGTPSAIVTDAVIISRKVDTTILVEEVNVAKCEEIEKVEMDIKKVGGNIAGIVLNKTEISKKTYEHNYRYYASDSHPTIK